MHRLPASLLTLSLRASLASLVLATGCVEKWEGDDADEDGVSVADGDCWDDPEGPPGSGLRGDQIYPGAEDAPHDGIDADCAGNDDYDLDGDGYVTDEAHVGLETLGVPGSGSGHVAAGDCVDVPGTVAAPDNGLPAISEADIYPGAPDTWYDGIDADCAEDDDYDADLDGDRASAYSDGTDCADDDPGRSGLLEEICDPDGVDEDCDELVNSADDSVDPETVFDYFTDADGDGFGDPATAETGCELPEGFVADGEDCDDSRADVNPDASEVCDDADVDEDCDGSADDADSDVVYAPGDVAFTDSDGDGYGDPAASVPACDLSGDLVDNEADCDDTDAAVNPLATEVCDGIDNDCVNGADDADPGVDLSTGTEFYADTDGDGFGDASTTTRACLVPSGYSADNTDCDDALAAVNPAATEVCNDRDDNCDGAADDADAAVSYGSGDVWYADTDSDAFGDASSSTSACDQPAGFVRDDTDCDDTASGVNPGATEVCDALDVDEDCSGAADDADGGVDSSTYSTFYADADGDSYGDASSTTQACDLPASGYVSDDTDCDDTDVAINPAATEVCDASDTDEDCDGLVDDADGSVDSATYSTFYTDADGDSYGDPGAAVSACDASAGLVTDDTDCDDALAGVNPGATEVCDAGNTDEDCDGLADDLDSSVDASGYSTFYLDADGDSYGLDGTTTAACDVPAGYSSDGGDCDDSESGAFPGNTEVCNDGLDADCDPTTCMLESDDLELAADAIWRGASNGDNLGYQVILGADLTGDGNPDVVAGSPKYSPTGTNKGGVFVLDGTAGLALDDGTEVAADDSSAVLIGEVNATWLGTGLAVGDFDGDGQADLIASGQRRNADKGRTYLAYGPITAGSTRTLDNGVGGYDAYTQGTTADDYLGWRSAVSDVNADGFDDLAVSAPMCDAASTALGSNSTGAGEVYLMQADSGTSWLDVAAPTATFTGVGGTSGCAGYDVGFQDVDGDGVDELLVGEPYAGFGGGIYFADASQTGSVNLGNEPKLTGPTTGARLGSAVQGAGDVDGDGYGDVLVGAPAYSSTDGVVYLIPGSATGAGVVGGGTGADAVAIATIIPVGTGTEFGVSIGGVGDLDGDGEADVVIGARKDATNGNNAGAAWVVHGPLSGTITTSTTVDAFFPGPSSADFAGWSVAGGTDVNNDGFDDVAVGAYAAVGDGGASGGGAVFMLLGRGN